MHTVGMHNKFFERPISLKLIIVHINHKHDNKFSSILHMPCLYAELSGTCDRAMRCAKPSVELHIISGWHMRPALGNVFKASELTKDSPQTK